MSYFNKILIANRGEIAVRVARTAARLGIKTVAVYSEADRNAPHVELCDEAVLIGPAAASESYLRIEKILDAAKRTGAEAIHPGYGFLSENATFARQLNEAGLTFIGPTAETIEQMGSKSSAKDLMEAAGVPIAPGYQGKSQTLNVFQAEAERIGYPVLLKATAGGGGKGMRLVERAEDLGAALKAAKQEAKSAFGDDRFLIEKYIARARHLEVQIFGDGKGEVVHLYERDCSVQRRHQKIIEEAPAPKLPAAVREKLLEAGVEAGRAVNYRGAGTVEFLYDGADQVYFMEMNTRLQVEHPVTEMITGQDLVEWQFRVAAGAGLPATQDQIRATGHAFESRLYAEDSDKDFAPSIGQLQTLSLPVQTARVDSGVTQGQEITPHYDPMIAKIITYGGDRSTALAKMRQALVETQVGGLQTNTKFLHRLSSDDAFKSGNVSTRYIGDHSGTLFSEQTFETEALCAYALYLRGQNAAANTGFRLNAPSQMSFWCEITDRALWVTLNTVSGGFELRVIEADTAQDRRDGVPAKVGNTVSFSGAVRSEHQINITIDGLRQSLLIGAHLDGYRINKEGDYLDIGSVDPLTPSIKTGGGESSLNAPMPGVILSVFVEKGEAVICGDPLISMEAMKMEHTIVAPYDGIVEEIKFREGEQVKDGDVLVELVAPSDEQL